MTRRIELPQAWNDTLSVIRLSLPSAYLAGGAIRDYDNHRHVKDLDVFFTEPKYSYSVSHLEDALAKLGYFYKSQCPGKYLDGTAREVEGSTVYQSTEGQPELNLIQLDEGFNPSAIIERVDFGLCQIGADLLGVEYTPAYEHDRINEVLTLTRADSVEGVRRSLIRYERLTQKYRGWPLNVPAEFEAIVAEARKPKQEFIVAIEEGEFN